MTRGLLLLLVCTVFSMLASVFIKHATTSVHSSFSYVELAGKRTIWLGAFCYAAAFVGYVYTLRTVPLSLAQPTITAGVSILTAVMAVWYFREPMNLINWLGLLLICGGMFLLFVDRV